MSSYFADYAWLESGLAADVRLVVAAGRFESVTADTSRHPNDERLSGVVFPGFANTHSHAFHRGLRGRTHSDGGSFWTWREQMYTLAERLDPDSYRVLARATYAEMALAGVTSVGEFHYLHHGRGGVPYRDPNAMGRALVQAAGEAGIRITLLDACYLAGGLTADGPIALDERQLRFGDRDATAWAQRVADFGDPGPHARIGAAIHSVRAVPRDQLRLIAGADSTRPLHVHLSEQPQENDQCIAAYGVTPTQLLGDAGVLSARTTAVHATHLREADIGLLGDSATFVSMCPSTEADLADGIGPARALADAGAPIVLGTDQHAAIDLLAEARRLELDQRLASGQRGRFTPRALVDALTVTGHAALGWTGRGPHRARCSSRPRLGSPGHAGNRRGASRAVGPGCRQRRYRHGHG